ncbi:putative nuclease HARBI1 [Teleopsis dalmanni]|uniref:putative nuclease HARBI1 n=1 Tax=Teleopsis dalmanni TaxID=139649 RepID=UPI0018CE0CB7|nr:putative nuclease HARBI1 [Teleopsis dalmanni]
MLLLMNALVAQVEPVPKKCWMKLRLSTFWEEEVPKRDASFFKENFRMTMDTFKELCDLVKSMKKQNSNFRRPIPLEKRVAIAVYALGSSAEYRTVGNLFGVSKSSVCIILKEFCTEVWKIMQPIYLNQYLLSEATIRDCINGFNILGFPQCISAIDGCHIEVRPRKSEAVDYYNYKGWYSVVLLAAVDYRCRFMYINIGCPGRCNDSQIFEKSKLKQHHMKPMMKEFCVEINGVCVPPLLLGDSAFRFSDILMKPYPFSEFASPTEKYFNYVLSKCRRVVENAFGHLKARFRRIGKGLDNHIDNVNLIVKSACVLHNFLNERSDKINLNWQNQLKEWEANNVKPQPEWTALLTDNDPTSENIRSAIATFLAELVSGTSGAEVKGVCIETGMFALLEHRMHVTQEDFKMAVAKVMQKGSEKNMSIKKLWK